MIYNPYKIVEDLEKQLTKAKDVLRAKETTFQTFKEDGWVRAVGDFVREQSCNTYYVDDITEMDGYYIINYLYLDRRTQDEFSVYISENPLPQSLEPRQLWQRQVQEGVTIKGFFDWKQGQFGSQTFESFPIKIDGREYFVGIYK